MVGASKFGRLVASTQKQQSLPCKQREKQGYTLIESSLITLFCFWSPCSGFSTLTPASQIIPIELGVVESRQEKSIICCVNTVRHEQFYLWICREKGKHKNIQKLFYHKPPGPKTQRSETSEEWKKWHGFQLHHLLFLPQSWKWKTCYIWKVTTFGDTPIFDFHDYGKCK